MSERTKRECQCGRKLLGEFEECYQCRNRQRRPVCPCGSTIMGEGPYCGRCRDSHSCPQCGRLTESKDANGGYGRCRRCVIADKLSVSGVCSECGELRWLKLRRARVCARCASGKPRTQRVSPYAGCSVPKILPAKEPTTAQPGSEEKIRVLTERWANGQSLWHPEDWNGA